MTCSISSVTHWSVGVRALRQRQRLATGNFRLPVPTPGFLVVSPPARMGNGESTVKGEFEGTPDVKAGRRGLLNSMPLPDDCLTLARNLKPTGVLLTPEAQEYEVSRTWQANPLLQSPPITRFDCICPPRMRLPVHASKTRR